MKHVLLLLPVDYDISLLYSTGNYDISPLYSTGNYDISPLYSTGIRGRIHVYRCMNYCNGEILHEVLSFSIVRSIVIITILHRIKFCHLLYVFTAITCITMLTCTCMLYFNLYLIVYFNFNKNNMYAKIFNIHVTLV